MRTLHIVPLLAALALTACGDMPSLQGIATKDNTVFDAALVGAWTSGEAVAIVRSVDNPGEKQSYKINWIPADGDDTPAIVRMEAQLAKIGDQEILDLTSSDPGAFAIPCHVFLRVRPVKEGLKLQFVDSTWIRDQIKSSGLANFLYEGHPVLSAPSGDVRAFLAKSGLDERALDEPILLRPLKQK